MKRLYALLLAVMLMSGCAAVAEETVDYAGYWLLTGAEMEGETYDPAALGVNAYMELYTDGTCLLVAMEEILDGVWTVTPTGITTTDANGDVAVYTYVDGALTVEEDGCKLFFTPEAYTMPLSGLTMADFEGDWVFTYVEVGNEVFYADELGVEMTLSLHDGKGVHTAYSGESGEVTDLYNGVCEIEEIPDFGTVMLLLYNDEAGQMDGGGIMLLMFDSEELVWYVIDEYDRSVSYCFVPAAMHDE